MDVFLTDEQHRTCRVKRFALRDDIKARKISAAESRSLAATQYKTMARQSDVMDKAVCDFVRRFEDEGIIQGVKHCGMNLDVYAPTPCTAAESGYLVMDSYETPIARVDLSKRDEKGHVAVELSAYCNYSVTTSRHLTYFLSALRKAGLIGMDVFDRRANRRNVEARAIEALHANGDNRHTTWFTL